MNYDMPLFRPPSEAFSLILQVTIGCSHNGCTFCGMYKMKKFRVKDWDEIEADINEAAAHTRGVKRVFLADGDALAMDTGLMIKLLDKLHKIFPGIQRVASYAGPRSILEKSPEELRLIRESGLKLLYLGVESGSDDILKSVKKGVTSAQMVEAGRKAKEAGFELSVTILTGLGGKEKSVENAVETALVLNRMQPDYVGALTLTPVPNTVLYQKIRNKEFEPLGPMEFLQELKLFLENLSLEKCIFRCNHASNYLPLRGTLPEDKENLTKLLGDVVSNPGKYKLKPEHLRGL
ncbi:MAG: radical SAM protein [Bacillota bacterium]